LQVTFPHIFAEKRQRRGQNVLMRDDDEFVNADAGYVGIQKRQELASDAHLSKVEWRVSERTMKVRYRGLGKNGGRLRMLFGLANISRWSWRQDSLSALATAR
jgi:IS5 family transposase